jgi:hypothetical protein
MTALGHLKRAVGKIGILPLRPFGAELKKNAPPESLSKTRVFERSRPNE